LAEKPLFFLTSLNIEKNSQESCIKEREQLTITHHIKVWTVIHLKPRIETMTCMPTLMWCRWVRKLREDYQILWTFQFKVSLFVRNKQAFCARNISSYSLGLSASAKAGARAGASYSCCSYSLGVEIDDRQ